MDFDSLIEQFGRQGQALIDKDGLGEFIFSEGTYQIEIIDGKKSYWPFLQIDDEGKILDALCSCDKEGGCEHLAAGCLKIYQGKKEPLHVRFKESFWNHLFKVVAKRHGYDTDILKKVEKGVFQKDSNTKKRLVFIQAKGVLGEKKLTEYIEKRVLETEENSIKFSNLSIEEISLWKEGKAPCHLLYELSFWSDLAKFFMLEQEKNTEYTIRFSEEKEGLPSIIQIEFPFMFVELYLARAYWPEIVPSLNTVSSPLRLYEVRSNKVEKITYDIEKKMFFIKGSKGDELKVEKIDEATLVGPWQYVEKKGFYHRTEDPLLENPQIPFDQIPENLQSYRKTFEEFLTGYVIDYEAKEAKYLLFFDQENNFHIKPYLFFPDDLDKPFSWYKHPWIFIQNKGFYAVASPLVDEKMVSKNNVSDFVDAHRMWLHDFEGFETHFGSLKAHLSYELSSIDTLTFLSEIDLPEEIQGTVDFGRWVYLPSQGFYHKEEKGLFLHPGLKIEKQEIGKFIKNHKEDLSQVENFFTEESPITRMGLRILLTSDERIKIIPEVEYAAGFTPASLKFFGDYVYVDKKGFFYLDPSLQLPEKYSEQTIISKKEEPLFLSFDLLGLKSFILSLDPRLKTPTELELKAKQIQEENKNYLVHLVYESEMGKVDASEIYEQIEEGKRFIFSKAGLIDSSEMRLGWMRRTKHTKKGKFFCFSTLEWIRLCLFEQVLPPKEGREVFDELMGFKVTELIDTSLLKSELRPYQKEGLNWLWFLYCHRLSGLLCDEMGLGKTHQAMALLAAALQKNQKEKYLVVCPTSVIYHWEELLHKFLPKMNVHIYYGTNRSLEGLKKADLLLTSFGILRGDIEQIKNIPFEISIFDELQIAKNEASLVHKALLQLNTTMRLGLTGTPIENRLKELKAIFDITLPAYLPEETEFRSLFISPIEKFQDENAKKLLARLISPFILRRRKKEVLLDLPDKIEEVVHCGLSNEQKQLYLEATRKSKELLLEDLKDGQKPVPYIHVFALLTQLKQICNHPCLITKDLKDYEKHESGKWDLFIELLNETRDSGQKLVIFSQYLQMLELIESHLKKEDIGFATIKGSTKDRAGQIKKFRSDPKCEVFTASLLAAGVGIDLSCASVVIHYDRWWNPAKENQATDRVHRIGQNRGVQVFKLVTRGTIEESIHTMIERKQKLIEEMLGQEDTEQIETLSRDELIEILEKTWKD